MTKTKRQLRAEAVERLSNYEEWHKKEKERHEDPDLLMAVIGGDSWGCTWQENRDALIDLLTDDEPTTAVNLYETSKRINSECESDGDAVSIMRNAQSKLLAPDYVRLAVGARDTSDMFAKLADMVERDYVRQANYRNLCKHMGKMQRERDEWKAKAERLDANGTADRTCPDAMGQASIVNADLPAENDVSSGHVDANDANSDSREKLEEDVRNGARYWAYDDSADAEANDECAKMLEDDVFSWLDRQAAITERDAFMRGRASLDDEFAELEAERDTWRNAAGNAHEMWEAEAESTTGLLEEVGRLRAERDYWKAECRDMLSEFYDTESEPCPMLEYPRPASACAPSILAMAFRQGMGERIAELEADCTTAEREEDRLRGEVAGLEAKLQAQNRMVTQLLFERDAYRDKCGRMLDAIHEAERVMEQ